MEILWMEVAKQLVTTLSGVAFIGLSTIAGIYVRKLTTSLQRTNLKKEIDSYVRAAEQSPSFKNYTGEQKYEVVKARAITWCRDNDVNLSEDEMMILIESSVKDMKLSGPILRANPVGKNDFIEGKASLEVISGDTNTTSDIEEEVTPENEEINKELEKPVG